MIRSVSAITLLCSLCYFASCFGFVFQDCGSKLGNFSDVLIPGCKTSDEKCALVRGTNSTIYITFTPNRNILQVNARVYGVISNIPVPFPINKPDVCKDPDDGITCPLSKDQEYHYKTTMFVQKKFPSLSVDVKWEFMTEHNEIIICLLFPVKIK